MGGEFTYPKMVPLVLTHSHMVKLSTWVLASPSSQVVGNRLVTTHSTHLYVPRSVGLTTCLLGEANPNGDHHLIEGESNIQVEAFLLATVLKGAAQIGRGRMKKLQDWESRLLHGLVAFWSPWNDKRGSTWSSWWETPCLVGVRGETERKTRFFFFFLGGVPVPQQKARRFEETPEKCLVVPALARLPPHAGQS